MSKQKKRLWVRGPQLRATHPNCACATHPKSAGPPTPEPRATHPNSAGPHPQSCMPPIQTPLTPSSKAACPSPSPDACQHPGHQLHPCKLRGPPAPEPRPEPCATHPTAKLREPTSKAACHHPNCAGPQLLSRVPAIQNRGPPAPEPRATHPTSKLRGPPAPKPRAPIQTPRAPSSRAACHPSRQARSFSSEERTPTVPVWGKKGEVAPRANGVELTASLKEYTGFNAAKTFSPQRSLFISTGPCPLALLSCHVRLHLAHLPTEVGDQVHMSSFPPRLLFPWRASPRWFPVGLSWSFHGYAWPRTSGGFPISSLGFAAKRPAAPSLSDGLPPDPTATGRPRRRPPHRGCVCWAVRLPPPVWLSSFLFATLAFLLLVGADPLPYLPCFLQTWFA